MSVQFGQRDSRLWCGIGQPGQGGSQVLRV
jgi:hypothetical protein